MSIPDGIMMGYVVASDTGESRDVVMHGTPMDLMRITTLLGLEMKPEHREAIMNDNFDHRVNGPLVFSDKSGSYVTIQPVSRASDFLANAAEQAYRNGMPFPF